MKFRVLDIETIPDLSVWFPGEGKWSPAPGLGFDGRPGPKAASAWFISSDERRHCDITYRKDEPFPPPHACRVVAISFVDILMDHEGSPRYRFGEASTQCLWAHDPPFDASSEAALLRNFAEAMGIGDMTIVTWNGRTFDLPALSMRSLKHGVPFGWYYSNRDMRYRFSDTGHLDLMDYLGDFGASRNAKLGDIARLIGLPGKIDMHGGDVLGIYRSTSGELDTTVVEAKMKSVAKYCLQDSIQTALIFLRSRFHIGKIDKAEYNHCLDTFAQSPAVTGAIEIDWARLRLEDKNEKELGT